MEQNKTTNRELYFNDPRFGMTLVSRLAVRVIGYAGNLILAALVFTLLFASLNWARYLGFLLALFLIDRLMHRGEADYPLAEMPKDGRVNLARYLKPASFFVLEKAYDRSSFSKSSFPLEVLRELLSLKEIKEGLTRMDIKIDEIKQKTEEFSSQYRKSEGIADKAVRKGQVETLVLNATNKALASGSQFIEPASLFSALPSLGDEFLSRIFSLFAIEPGDLENAMIFGSLKNQFSSIRRLPRSIGEFVKGPRKRLRHRIMNRAWTSRPTPTLDRYSYDMTDLARKEKVGFLIGHEMEYQRMESTLARSINPNVLLIGEVGAGKETLINHLAFQIVKDKVPAALFDRRLVSLELASLVAGATPDELQDRLDNISNEIIAAGNVILYVPDVHNLVRTSGTSYLSAADALMPIFMDNSFPVIGATYPKEYKELLQPRTDFVGIFEKIMVNEITEDEAEKFLVYESVILERDEGVLISFGSIKKSVNLAKKYFRAKLLPSSAEELLKSAIMEAKRRGSKVLSPETVIEVAETKVNVPIHEATEEEAQKLINLEEIIHKRLVDQEEAVRAVSNVLREYRSGLTKPGGPIASFLFVGPTGVGKTELSKILTKIQFGATDLMVRFDMSEYQDKQSFYRFIGSPDGKISGALTDAIIQKPYSLILLDEFEKAFPDILNLFLQVLDDGRLTDNSGRVVDFQNTIIIATSNAHSDIINEALRQGQTMIQIAEYLKKKLVDVFKPELLNRFSKIVVFNNLGSADIEKIAMINLADFAKLAAEQGITLNFDPEAIKEVARLGFDPTFGARPLERVIAEKLRAPLAEKILKKEVIKGGKYRLNFKDEQFGFEEEK